MKSPDGICLDPEGAVWVAAFEEDAFIRLDRERARIAANRSPGRRAIACALGGTERRTLFCLSAATSYEELRQRKSSARIDVVEWKSPVPVIPETLPSPSVNSALHVGEWG